VFQAVGEHIVWGMGSFHGAGTPTFWGLLEGANWTVIEASCNRLKKLDGG
jgi:hypothetical protein